MSEDTATATQTVDTITSVVNGFNIEMEGLTLSKGKGKGRYVLVFSGKYAKDVDSLITLIKAFPESVPHIYKNTFRSAALAASDGNVKSISDIAEHDYDAELKAEWSVGRSADPIKQAEHELVEFKDKNAEIDTFLATAMSNGELQNLFEQSKAGVPEAVAQINRLTEYGRELQQRNQRIAKLKAEKKNKKAKKAKAV